MSRRAASYRRKCCLVETIMFIASISFAYRVQYIMMVGLKDSLPVLAPIAFEEMAQKYIVHRKAIRRPMLKYDICNSRTPLHLQR